MTGRHATTQDNAAARLFPSEGTPRADQPPPAGKEGDDPERVLFKDDAAQFDAKPVKDFVSGFAASAATDGDHDRAKALEAAGEALVEDFKAAGSDAKEVAEAFDIIRMRQADTIAGPVSTEKLQAEYGSTMAALEAEGVTTADIDAARAFIRDLEIVAPGTMDSLERTGAGSDARLIRKAIAEAKRRGY
ncbi:MAG: hypothetical protein KJZ80_16120 [Hyphomicrobiaceae bacterium]|nr:hypothetical protein [Hyphomicrobiaceae bacterium]